jgi:hypothetical protein
MFVAASVTASQHVVFSELDILSIRTEEIRGGAGYNQAHAVPDDHIRALPA